MDTFNSTLIGVGCLTFAIFIFVGIGYLFTIDDFKTDSTVNVSGFAGYQEPSEFINSVAMTVPEIMMLMLLLIPMIAAFGTVVRIAGGFEDREMWDSNLDDDDDNEEDMFDTSDMY